MRKAIMGVGTFLVVVGLIQLILSVALIGPVRARVGGIDPLIEDAAGMLTEVADSVDRGADFLEGLCPRLGKVAETIERTIEDSVRQLGDLDVTLATVDKRVTKLKDDVILTRDSITGRLEHVVVEIRTEDLEVLAVGLKIVGVNDVAALLRDWAAYIDPGWRLCPQDLVQTFTPVIENLELASNGLSDTGELLDTAKTSLEDIKTPALGGISNTREFLQTAQADLGGLGDGLRNTSKGIVGLEIGGMIGGMIGWLQTYMIITSILFMAAGAGLFMVGKKAES